MSASSRFGSLRRLLNDFLHPEQRTVRVAAASGELEAIMAVDALVSAGVQSVSSGSPHLTGGSSWYGGGFDGGFGSDAFYIWVKRSDVAKARDVLQAMTVDLLETAE